MLTVNQGFQDMQVLNCLITIYGFYFFHSASKAFITYSVQYRSKESNTVYYDDYLFERNNRERKDLFSTQTEPIKSSVFLLPNNKASPTQNTLSRRRRIPNTIHTCTGC